MGNKCDAHDHWYSSIARAGHRASRRGKGALKEIIWVDSRLWASGSPERGETWNWLGSSERSGDRDADQKRPARRAVKIEHVRSHTGVPGNELADKLAEWGLYLDEKDPNLPYGVEKARPMMREIVKRGQMPDPPQPLGAAGVPSPRGDGTHPSNPPTLSPSEQTASGDG